MIQEFVDDPIEMICYFGENEIKPIRFRYKNDVIKIASVNGYWSKHEGTTLIHFWAVSTKTGTYYELEFNSASLKWKVRKIVDDV